ncbi:MAG: histidinol-phosphate transaminase [Candidatus Protistobacter heckmanni]|nr:histidinol-phosphate transaminase [Candidatus Protistobacter heckmanni]
MSASAKLAQRIFRAEVLGMHAYAVPDARGMVKFDAMENPYALPEALRAKLAARLAEVALNRYPVPSYAELIAALRAGMEIPAAASVILGNGSDELISMLSVACAKPGAVMLAPLPGFVMYKMSAELAGCRFVGVPLTPQFQLDATAMRAAIAEHKPAVVYVAYPNNPTGALFDDADVARLIAAAPATLFVIDEAYQPFAGKTWMGRLGEFPNLAVMRTVSKLGLAGLRLGLLAGPPELVSELDKVRPPYNVNVLTEAAAVLLLEDKAVLDEQAALLRAERETLRAELAALPGVEVFASDANFLLLRVPGAAAAFQGLRQRGVLVKNVSTMHELLAGCLRVTVGTPEENRRFLDAFQQALQD